MKKFYDTGLSTIEYNEKWEREKEISRPVPSCIPFQGSIYRDTPE